MTEWVTAIASGPISFVIKAPHTRLPTVVALFVDFSLTRNVEKIVSHVIDVAPTRQRTTLRRLVAESCRIWGCFFRSQLILCLIVAVILGAASAVPGLPGIWAGLREFLLAVGHIVWCATAVALAVFSG